MKTIGLVGGLGPESTLDYYKGIIDAFKGPAASHDYPEIVIFSANLAGLMQMLETENWPRMTDWLVERIEALARAGADFAAICSNTPHVVFDKVQARSPLELVSIVTQTLEHAQKLGLRRLGLLGTLFTMRSTLFQRELSAAGMTVVSPEEAEQELIHHRLFTEIELGIFKSETRDELLGIAAAMQEREGLDGIILGCTELPLILDRNNYGIPFLNTTAIHIESIVQHCLE